MAFDDSNLAKDLECPVCLDLFDEPKLLNCGHTVCQTCVGKVIATRRNGADAHQERERNCIQCPECSRETEIPPDGLPTNYRLVGLIRRAQMSLVDVCACNGCGKQAPVAEMYTCETCQEALIYKPIWLCAACALKQHRDHALSECNKPTQQQIHEACQGIARSGSLAAMRISLTMSHLTGALELTEIISQLLRQHKRGFSRLENRVKSADDDFTRDDLAASLQEATDLKQKFEQASTFANEAGKGLKSVLQDFCEKLHELFPKEQEDEPLETEDSGTSGEEETMETEDSGTSDEEPPMETEDNGTSHNILDLSKCEDGQEAIWLGRRGIDLIPDLSRFAQLQFLGLDNNLLKSINDNVIHATLTGLDLHGNQITKISGLNALVNLEILDVSFNRLKKIKGLTNLVKLKRIYLEHNIIEKIQGLETLVNLELLELSDNRIKAVENLDSQHNLRELRLGRNEIRKIANISHLSKLRLLSIEGNRIMKLENLGTLVDLEELYVSKQGIETFDGIQKLNKLKLIDAARNSIASLDHLGHLQQLENLRLNDNKVSKWTEVDKLVKLAKLRSVHLEGNPIQTQDRENYRHKVIQALPQVTEVDDTPCR